MCIFCTGPEHAWLAVTNPQASNNCADMPQKIRELRRKVATANNRGPNQDVIPRPFWADKVEDAYPLNDDRSDEYPCSQGAEEDPDTMECVGDDLWLTGDTNE